jgi:hypothetical protein
MALEAVDRTVTTAKERLRWRYVHELDNPRLSLKKRVILQDNVIQRVKHAALVQTEPALSNKFRNDIVGREIYLRQDLNHTEDSIAAAVGYTQSDIKGITGTAHTIFYKPPEAKKTLKFSQETRRKEFAETVLPNAERVVVMVPGWGSTRNVFEIPVNQKILNPDKNLKYDDPKKLLKDGKTIVISLSIMGSEGDVDPEKASQFGPFSAVAQVMEALDRIGLQVMRHKANQIVGPDWVAEKNTMLTNFNLKPPADTTRKQDMNRLVKMLRDENDIKSGGYWHKRLMVTIGHSMGAWIIIQKFLANNYGNYKNLEELTTHWPELSRAAGAEIARIKRDVDGEAINYPRTLGRNLELHERIEKYVANLDENLHNLIYPYEDGRPLKDLYPNSADYGLAPVEAGTAFYDQLAQDAKTRGIVGFEHHVSFLRNSTSFLIDWLNRLADTEHWTARRNLLRAGNASRVTPYKTRKFIGRKAYGSKELIVNHMFSLWKYADFHSLCTQIINAMPRLAGEDTIKSLGIDKVLGRLHVYIPDKDETLSMTAVHEWIRFVLNLLLANTTNMSSTESVEFEKALSTSVENSPHYLTEKGWDDIADRSANWLQINEKKNDELIDDYRRKVMLGLESLSA